MKRLMRAVLCLLCLSVEVGSAADSSIPAGLKEGDIIFRKTGGRQSLALTLATGSIYTHCGLLLLRDGKLEVLEAADRVRWTGLEDWINRGTDGHYVIMRLKRDFALPPAVAEAMRRSSAHYIGKPYDILFQWSDEAMYCSELVWKIYQRSAGRELGRLRGFYDYDLNHREVQAIIRERYGLELPAGEQVITPSELMDCGLLEVVSAN